jgi:hypothetical protein
MTVANPNLAAVLAQLAEVLTADPTPPPPEPH